MRGPSRGRHDVAPQARPAQMDLARDSLLFRCRCRAGGTGADRGRGRAGRSRVRYTPAMRREAEIWLLSAGRDGEVAAELVAVSRYSHAVFFAHQAAEKALKAAVLVRAQAFPPLTHSLRLLAQRTGEAPPEDVETAMLRLMPHYMASRYPDVAQGQPELHYNRALASELLCDAEVVRAWAAGLCQEGTA